MPTPVTTARQCLTTDAVHALDEAVAVARRRAHAQTTSLHVVSALLSIPSSSLREACSRARNSAYSARIQFKALELCLGVSLDRLPSSPQRAEEPPVSNSLMAAIKRSQANQRRQPESFHLYQQQQQQSSSVSTVKVELQNLVLSILDDPVVSRVFGEAGFRSCDIKLAILRPVHQLFRYSRYRGPPVFLCNLTGDSDPGHRGFSFPFLGCPGISNGDENSRRIGEVLVRNKGRNPLLIGICATGALQLFCENVETRKIASFLPVEIYGLNVIRVENDVSKFINEDSNEALIKSRFREVAQMAEHCIGPGVVISCGDLKEFIGDDDSVAASSVVGELARLLDLHGAKVWLIGAAETYETYLKFLNRFPSVEKDWDLQLLPITSPRSSLMESFVPFGGFFSTSSDSRSPLGGSCQYLSRCHLCNEKCEQEVSAIASGGFAASIAEQYQSNLPAWLQTNELNTNTGLDVMKAKDDGLALSAKIKGLQRKWDNMCQRLHHANQLTRENIYQLGPHVPAAVGLPVCKDKKENGDNHSSSETNASSNASGCRHATSCMSMGVQKNSSSQLSIPQSGVSIAMDASFLSKMRETTSESDDLERGGLRSPPLSLSNSSVIDDRMSPPSATSVTTDLGLGIYSVSTRRELKKSTNLTQADLVQDFSGCLSANVDLATVSAFNCPAQSSSCSYPVFDGQFDLTDFKMLHGVLSERISWQEEAVSAICRAIARCRTRNEKRFGASPRGDMWFTFLGPDSFGKKRIAVALAEMIYRNRGNFIHVDLSSQDGMIRTNAICDSQEMNGYDVKFRGKTVVDYVAGELSNKPLSVVFLENVDQADALAQNSLSQAVRTGRFLDSHGREVGINNTVFVTTSRFMKDGKVLSSAEESSNYSEEKIQRARGWPIQMVIGCALGNGVIRNDLIASNNVRKGISSPVIVNKRKSIGAGESMGERETLETAKRAHKASDTYLDLNLPAEEIEVYNSDSGNSRSGFISENSKVWLEDFMESVDETVVFKPFDFDILAEKISDKVSKCFCKIFGSNCLLEIDSKVMEQMLAAACLSENNRVEDWIEQVLSRGFVEAKKRHDNLRTPFVVKLVTREDLLPEEQAQGVHLPARIFVD